MAGNKFVINGVTELDLTSDTVDVAHLAQGYTAHDKSGNLIVGAMAGGALPSGFSNIATGSYTLSSAVAGGKTFTIDHNLGVVPDMFMIWAPSNIATTYSMLFAGRSSQFAWRGSSYPNLCYYHGNSTTTATGANVTTAYGVKTLSATQATVTTFSNSTSYYWRAGTYKWLAIKF